MTRKKKMVDDHKISLANSTSISTRVLRKRPAAAHVSDATIKKKSKFSPKAQSKAKKVIKNVPKKSLTNKLKALAIAKKSVKTLQKSFKTKQKGALAPSTDSPKIKSKKRKIENNEVEGSIIDDDGGKEISSKLSKKSRKKQFILSPNLSITQYEKDPTFESNKSIPFISPIIQSKLLIRAVLLNDQKYLTQLLKDKKYIFSLCLPRSISVNHDALYYAFQNENVPFIKVLMQESTAENLGESPVWLIREESTGRGNRHMFGHALRAVSLGRGGKEGNAALLKDANCCHGNYTTNKSWFSTDVVRTALTLGISTKTLEILSLADPDSEHLFWNKWLPEVVFALRGGHNELASYLVEKAISKNGFGFNSLHQEALVVSKKTPFKPFKAVSVTKMSIGNSRITPLHCAAINPDVYALSTLISLVSETNPDTGGWNCIHYAAACTSSAPLELLLSRGVSSSELTKEKETPIFIAAKLGRSKNVQVILDYKAKNKNNEDTTSTQSTALKLNKLGENPLHIGAKYGHDSVIKVLISSSSIDINKATPGKFEKTTPFMIACQMGHLSAVKTLISLGARIEIIDKKGRTGLCYAVMNGHAHVVSYLLRLGDNHLVKDTSGNSLVHYASAYGWYFNLLLLLEAGCCPNEGNQWKMTPLAISFMKGHIGLVEVLLKHPGVDVNAPIDDTVGMTLLHKTCASAPTEDIFTRLKFLIDSKANPKVKDQNGRNAVHHLVIASGTEISSNRQNIKKGWTSETEENPNGKHTASCLKLLIEKGAESEGVDSNGHTPMSLAFSYGAFDVALELLKLGASLNCQRDSEGNNLLHLLIPHLTHDKTSNFIKNISKNPETSKALKSMCNEYNSDGFSPLLLTLNTYSKIDSETDVKKITEFILFLVLKLGSDVNGIVRSSTCNDSVLHLAVQCNYAEDVLNVLLSKKPELEVVNKELRTPLALSIVKKNKSGTKMLLEHGANPNFISERDEKKSMLLLEVSTSKDSYELVPLFVRSGAVVNRICYEKNKNSILHFVAKNPCAKGVEPALKSLIAAGGDVNARNKYGRTCLHLACNARGGETDVSYSVEDILIEGGANLKAADENGRLPLHYTLLKIGKKQKEIASRRKGNFIDPIELVTIITGAMKERGLSREIDAVDDFGQSALHCAAIRGATISASHLLSSSSMPNHINLMDSDGNTPFALSILHDHEGSALMFLQNGANFTTGLNRGFTHLLAETIPKDWIWSPLLIEINLLDKENESSGKTSIIQEIVQKDWQGLLYLILEKLNLNDGKSGLAHGVDAALRAKRFKLVLKLMNRVKLSHNIKNYKEPLLHIFAGNASGANEDDIKHVFKEFLAKGLSLDSLDEENSTPLIRGAMKRNVPLCKMIFDEMMMSEIPLFTQDIFNRTSFTALFWNPFENRKIEKDLEALSKVMMKYGADFNHLTQYPVEISQNASVRYFRSENSPSKALYSPLIISIIYGNLHVVKWLLATDKVDINGQDSLGMTPLMHAVRLNDIRLVKLLLNPKGYDFEKDTTPWCISQKKKFQLKSKLNVNGQDGKGWTALHHIVSPLDPHSSIYYSHATELISVLLSISANVGLKNNSGETALEMALKLKKYKLAKVLERGSKKSGINFNEYLDFPLIKDGIETIPPNIFVRDGREMLNRIKSSQKEIESNYVPEPDSLSGLSSETSAIIVDENSKELDVLLTQVDLSYGVYGLYNFYKMQLIKQTRGPELILLFTRWGRVGDKGQFQKTPFPTLEEGISEFKKIFRSKTGLIWGENELPTAPNPKKYRVVNVKKSGKNKVSLEIGFKLIEESKIKPKMCSKIYDLVTILSLEHKSKAAIVENKESLPLGLINLETLHRAEEILEKVDILLKNRDDLNKNKNNPDKDKIASVTESIISLSEEYFSILPVSGYAFEAILPMLRIEELRKQQEILQNLLHNEFATTLLLGSQYNLSTQNPFEYIYKALGTKIEILDSMSEECQLILSYIYNTSEKRERGVVEAIYRISISGAEENLSKCGIGNRHLLWHGTKTCNLLSILHRGLQVQPLGYSFNGSLFGKGIYFADMFAKSIKYCSGSSRSKFMLLCEVALGNVQNVEIEYRPEGYEPLKPGNNSLKTSNSRYRPLPNSTVCWKGRTVPIGTKCENIIPDDKNYGLDFNEYIIFKPEQVNIRYLVQFRTENFPNVKLSSIFN